MRDANFRSIPSNRATVTITRTLYDRRALDCTADKPLVCSLKHLVSFTASSERIREMLCFDGGVERLVAILKECRDDTAGRDNTLLLACKWTFALQCLVFLCTRGNYQIRQRIVEAGLIPVLATILDNYLQAHEVARLEFVRQRNAAQQQQQYLQSQQQQQQQQNISQFQHSNVDIQQQAVYQAFFQRDQEDNESLRAPTLATVSTVATVGSEPFEARMPSSTSISAASFANSVIQNSDVSLSRSRVPLHSQASHAVFHTHAHVRRGDQESTFTTGSSGSVISSNMATTRDDTPRVHRSTSPESRQDLESSVSTLNSQVQVPTPAATGWTTEYEGRREIQAANTPTHSDSASRPNSVAPASTSSSRFPDPPRQFENHLIKLQHEDIVWALEILCFVSKYPDFKEHLQNTHIIPSLSTRPQYASKNSEEVEYDYDEYDFEQEDDIDEEFAGQELNLFPVVEQLTSRKFHKDLQYWAGVIMRNSCRKDEERGGVRQCARSNCGKWEEFPRQFAKCRRCKRTKYCCKECQLQAWPTHRYWCVSSGASSSRTGTTVTEPQQTQQTQQTQQASEQAVEQQRTVEQRPAVTVVDRQQTVVHNS